jgi:hypothetical protein
VFTAEDDDGAEGAVAALDADASRPNEFRRNIFAVDVTILYPELEMMVDDGGAPLPCCDAAPGAVDAL